jgi:hypothetical protein
MSQNVIDKIRQLLALAASTTSEHEAQAALEAATKIAEANRLSMADIKNEAGVAEPLREDDSPLFSCGKICVWQSQIVAGLAVANGCCSYTVRRRTKGHFTRFVMLFGRPTDMAIVRELWTYVVPALDRAWNHGRRTRGKMDRHSWWFGASNGVCESLDRGKAAARKNATTTSIVWVDQRALAAAQALSQIHPDMPTEKPRKVRANEQDYYHGRRAGREVMEQRTRTQLEPPHRTVDSRTGQIGLDFGSEYDAGRRSP